MFGSTPTQAIASQIDLYQAKQQGIIGERPDGLVGIVNAPGDTEEQALVSTVNEGRLESYREIAQKRSLAITEVQKLAGKTLISKTPEGQYVMTPDGAWIQK